VRLLREPLLHFFLLGAGLFVLFGVVADSRARAPDRIVVGASDVALLAEGFARTWQRPPTEEELAGLVSEHVKEEILYREALALELDRDDTIVRRRLRQKLEFLLDADAPTPDPNEEDLEQHLVAHRQRFEEPPRVSLRQVYLSVDRRADAARSDAEHLLARLRASDEGWERAGDVISLPPEHAGVERGELASLFGAEFAARTFTLPVGSWEGPIASGYGLHLVLVSARSAGRLPPLAEVREDVLRDWQAVRRAEANARRLAELSERYEVRVEWPAAAPREGSAE
jgi:hypothetical protein